MGQISPKIFEIFAPFPVPFWGRIPAQKIGPDSGPLICFLLWVRNPAPEFGPDSGLEIGSGFGRTGADPGRILGPESGPIFWTGIWSQNRDRVQRGRPLLEFPG